MLRIREIVFPREKHTNWLLNIKRPELKTYIQVAVNIKYIIYKYMFIPKYNIYACMHEKLMTRDATKLKEYMKWLGGKKGYNCNMNSK